jgi:hypothetical protein
MIVPDIPTHLTHRKKLKHTVEWIAEIKIEGVILRVIKGMILMQINSLIQQKTLKKTKYRQKDKNMMDSLII